MLTPTLAFTALSFLSTPIPGLSPAPGDGKKLEADVDRVVAGFLEKKGAVGMSVAIARKGEVVLAKGYGFADLEFHAKCDAETCFRIGSVTKQFTAALVMRYVEWKQLGLDDDLSKYVPDFPLQGKHVTIRQLLNHTSGIPSYTDIGEAWERVWPLELEHAELLALVKDKPFDFEPGTKWAYDNTGYYLLGMVLEKVGGKPYEDLVEEHIAKPLGLARTRRDSNVDLVENRAQGYTFRPGPGGGTFANDQPYGTNQPGAAGFLLSTARDLVTWQVGLTSGKTVSKESFALMSTPAVLPDGKDTGYGFGLGVGEFEGRKRISHGGGIFGFNSMLAWYPDDDLHIAVISNGETLSSGKVADELVWAALGIEKPKEKDLAIPAETLAKFAGTYRIGGLGLLADVTTEDGKLFLQARAEGQGKFRLKSQGGSEFRADFDPSVKVVFGPDGKSFCLHQGGGQFEATREP
ncbi:MAG: serine hydrolase [Planctomycetes bacterium]|nr:serine hydrolase [Planctomycetota bacterium]